MKFSGLLTVQVFQLASVFHLCVVHGGELFARPDTITNVAAGEEVLFPIQSQGREDQCNITFKSRFPQTFEILELKSNNPEKLHIVYPLYQHRVGIYRNSVILYDVQVNDSGEYEMRIDCGTKLKRHDRSSYRKHVFVYHLFVVCNDALLARPDTITNARKGAQVRFPMQPEGNDSYDVTFGLKLPRAFKILTWKSSNPEKLHIVHPLYRHRVGIQRDYVVLNDVQVIDTGVYEIYVDYYGTVLKNRGHSMFTLHVIEPVSHPMTAIYGNCVNSTNITLGCSVSKESNITIHWEKVSVSGVLSEIYNGSMLVVDCGNEEEQYEYRCFVENPVSNATSNLVTIGPYYRTNTKGQRTCLIVLVPLAFIVVVSASVFLWSIKRKPDSEQEIAIGN
ncbi:SLAM family member 5-like [Stegostoma tigrinum]|uniref:SLAM family member 5-like n=1 Tax=Stegostoma tigrinum TaxID=3053191 RepID=UPI00286FC4C6|nr:SLAM family member 5-like [Stegostoma tigrinum]XP_059507012.1 SLAM family member 5-like [Stegostoma tigrinum]XP_059507013.1 SLAM family member 5-like [Stegostoma tigrinum]XP_059507014.1 SLAM family member 5-like [Stegostoma tigrinum]